MNIGNQTSFFTKIRPEFFIAISLIIITLLVYIQVIDFEFIEYDDYLYTIKCSQIQNGLNVESISWAFTSIYPAVWQPVIWLSLMVDYQLYGLNPGGYHLTNVLIHIVNILLLFFLLKRMTGNLWQSSCVAFLFALHPLHVESVAWVAERKDVMFVFFWMLTTWAYIKYVERPGIAMYLLVMFFFIMGLMSKAMIVTLPFALLLLDYWPLKRIYFESFHAAGIQGRLISRIVVEKVPLIVMAGIVSAYTVYVEEVGGAISSFDAYPLGIRISNMLITYVVYIKKMLWPFDLSATYLLNPTLINTLPSIGAAVLLAIIFYIIFQNRFKRPYLITGWLWYVGTLVPTVGLVQFGVHIRADRFTYIPLIGLYIIIAWGLPELLKKGKCKEGILIALSAVLIPCLVTVTFFQVRYWRNSITIYSRALEFEPDNTYALSNLGAAYFRRGEPDKGVVYIEKLLLLQPGNHDLYFKLGNAYRYMGDLNAAAEQYEKAIEIKPDFINAVNELARTYKKMIKRNPTNTDL